MLFVTFSGGNQTNTNECVLVSCVVIMSMFGIINIGIYGGD